MMEAKKKRNIAVPQHFKLLVFSPEMRAFIVAIYDYFKVERSS